MIITFLLWMFGFHFTSSASLCIFSLLPPGCGLMEVELGAWSSPYKMAEVTHSRPWTLKRKDPETKKWMQSNLVFSLPNNSLRSSYHLLIHVLALKLVWGCSSGAQAELCSFFTGISYLTRLHAEHGQREQESLLYALWAHAKNRLSSFSRHIH